MVSKHVHEGWLRVLLVNPRSSESLPKICTDLHPLNNTRFSVVGSNVQNAAWSGTNEICPPGGRYPEHAEKNEVA